MLVISYCWGWPWHSWSIQYCWPAQPPIPSNSFIQVIWKYLADHFNHTRLYLGIVHYNLYQGEPQGVESAFSIKVVIKIENYSYLNVEKGWFFLIFNSYVRSSTVLRLLQSVLLRYLQAKSLSLFLPTFQFKDWDWWVRGWSCVPGSGGGSQLAQFCFSLLNLLR